MDTHFASADRATPVEIRRQVEAIVGDPIVSALLKAAEGVIAVLNVHRQILAVNEAFLKSLGIDDPGAALGLRPGEFLGCVHADSWPGGCGTGPDCPSCGAVIAMVASLQEQAPQERVCALRARQNGGYVDKVFRVRSVPVVKEGQQFLLLYLNDITLQEHDLALTRMFLHDISNLTMNLDAAEELAAGGTVHGEPRDPDLIKRLVQRLASLVRAQRSLLALDDRNFQTVIRGVRVAEILSGIADLLQVHGAAAGVLAEFPAVDPDWTIRTDPALVHRVLANMVVNACEASDKGQTVKVGVENREGDVVFIVHNEAVMPPTVARRVFQRHFSTKTGHGRGLGTFSMKVLAEDFLGGAIDFESRPGVGTRFSLTLPDAGNKGK